MDPIYTAISWILLRWHALWDAILPNGRFLATNWDWILAIVFLVVTVRVILFPLFVKQIKSQRAMQTLAPQIKALQEQYRGDREGLQKATMELYRKEKANPLMGCLPMFLQIPVFLGLFHVLRRLSTTYGGNKLLYGWTANQFDNASMAHLFNAPIPSTFQSGETVSKVVAGILVLIMITTTYLTSKQMILKTGWSEDSNQRLVQKLMLYGIPVSLLFSGFVFPIGVIIYWVTQNLFSMGQQFWVLKKYPPPPMAKKAAAPVKTTGAGRPAAKAGAGRSPNAARAAATKAAGTKAARDRTIVRRPGSKAAAAAAAEAAAAEQAALERKALAPKPGAKPVNPKKSGSRTRRPAG